MNRLDEPVFMAVSKHLLTEFGIHHRLESCSLEIINFSQVAFSLTSIFSPKQDKEFEKSFLALEGVPKKVTSKEDYR